MTDFSYRSTKGGKVFISWRGRTVTTLAGSAARAFLARVSGASPAEAQRAMHSARLGPSSEATSAKPR